MNNRILVPVDGPNLSMRALDAGVDLARSLGAGLTLCHVIDPAKAAMMTFGNPQFVASCLDALRAEGESIVQIATQRAGQITADVESCLLQGSPAEEITRSATEQHVGWIVMGSHSRSGLNRVLMGSVAEGVLRLTPVPVMIVPAERKHVMTSGSAGSDSDVQ